MKSIAETLQKQEPKKRPAPHPLAATVDLIEEARLFSGKYGRGYWLRQVSLYQKRHKIEPEVMFNRMQGMLKEIADLPPEYSKGGRLTNLLRK